MVTPHFELKDAVLELNDVVILKDVSINIQSHTFTQITGENGSGKSCLIATLLNLYTVSKGIQRTHFNKKDLCYIPAHPTFFDSERVNGCLRFYCILYHTSLKTLCTILESLSLDYASIKSKKFSELSSGMQQKIHIIPLFLENLSIYFLDEITQNLDVDSLEIVRHRIQTLNKSGKTIVMVDHNSDFLNSCYTHNKEHYQCSNKTVQKL